MDDNAEHPKKNDSCSKKKKIELEKIFRKMSRYHPPDEKSSQREKKMETVLMKNGWRKWCFECKLHYHNYETLTSGGIKRLYICVSLNSEDLAANEDFSLF